MNDQSGNIFFLNAPDVLKVQEITARKLSAIKTQYNARFFTALLSKKGVGLSKAWFHQTERPLNRCERIELQALIYYASKISGIDEAFLSRTLEIRFGVDSVQEIPAVSFSEARLYLQSHL